MYEFQFSKKALYYKKGNVVPIPKQPKFNPMVQLDYIQRSVTNNRTRQVANIKYVTRNIDTSATSINLENKMIIWNVHG